MDLLSGQEKYTIESALRNIRDTYFKTPISITRTGVGGVLPDRWNSGTTKKSGASQADTYSLLGMVEYRDPTTSFFMDNVGGADGDFDIMITVGVDEAIASGVISAERKSVVRDGDTVAVANNGEKYRIIAILFDGHFDSSGQLLMFKCKRETLE